MRPVLKAALRRAWRDHQTVQIGLDPDHATVVTGLDDGLADVLDALTGTRTVDAVVSQAQAHGVDAARTRRLLRILADSGVLDDADQDGGLRGLGPAERERLGPDLAALSLASRRPGGGDLALLRRRRAHLVVHGAGRVGATVAALLAASGVGRVSVLDQQPSRPADVAPGGLGHDDVGLSRAAGAHRRVHRVRVTSLVHRPERADPKSAARELPRADLVVLAPDEDVDRRLSDIFVRDGVAHLVARVRETRGVVGPLVIPGTTSCLRCHDLHRMQRDPAWPDVVRQAQAGPAVHALDVVLASTVAGLAVLHALAFLDDQSPPSVDGTVELTLPHGVARRRSWSAHPGCGCQWSHLASEATPA